MHQPDCLAIAHFQMQRQCFLICIFFSFFYIKEIEIAIEINPLTIPVEIQLFFPANVRFWEPYIL